MTIDERRWFATDLAAAKYNAVNYNTNYILYCHCQLLSASCCLTHNTQQSKRCPTSEAGFASSADDPMDGTEDGRSDLAREARESSTVLGSAQSHAHPPILTFLFLYHRHITVISHRWTPHATVSRVLTLACECCLRPAHIQEYRDDILQCPSPF